MGAIPFPTHRTPADQVLAQMQAARENDVRWHEGRAWSLVYHATDELADLLTQAHSLFLFENALNPMVFPSLRRFEAEVVAMTASLLGGDAETSGNMTSGGTESLLLAVKTARDWARALRPEIREPEMLLPETAHPALHKAAAYLDVKPVLFRVGSDFRADVQAAEAALTDRTILLVASAPCYPYGVVDPVADLAALAQARGILCHVDACVGGFMLPFVRKLGHPVPDFDFQVPGVTSISADLHKYGYAAKGASLILYRNKALRRYQFFVYPDWPGGVYASPTMAGTRPGGPIAAAWAALHHLGEEGYLALADGVMKAVARLREGIGAIAELRILGEPVMSILAIASDHVNIYQVGDELALRGWHLDRQQSPPSLHLTVTPAHAQVVDPFLEDLRQAVVAVRRPSLVRLSSALKVGLVQAAAKILPPEIMSAVTARAGASGLGAAGVSTRSAALYGMMASLPNRDDLSGLVLDLLDRLTAPEPKGVSAP